MVFDGLPLTDEFAAIAPRITGSLSALSSSLIIYLIFRSKAKLSTIYHRIMFGMSCADILGSTAMGLTTLPMPRDSYLYYDWAGTQLGNSGTCKAQGFFFVFGMICMFVYNVALCCYYACIIAFKMKEKVVKKKIEPFLHLVPIGVALLGAVPPLFFNLYQASGWEAWCTVSINENNIENNVAIRALIGICIVITITNLCTLCIACFVFIVWRVRQTERFLNPLVSKHGRIKVHRRSTLMTRTKESHQNTKVILTQSLAYIICLLITTIPPVARSLIVDEGKWVIRLQAVMMPLQGFFNTLIFIYHKVYNYRRLHDDASLCHILRLLFAGSLEEQVLFSRISMLKYDQDLDKVEIELADEDHAIIFSVDAGAEDFIDLERMSSKSSHLGRNVTSITSTRDGLSGFSSQLSKPLSNVSYDQNKHDETKEEIINDGYHTGISRSSNIHNNLSNPFPHNPNNRVNPSIDAGLSFSSPSAQISHGNDSKDSDSDGHSDFNINENESISRGWWFSRV